MEKAIKAVLEKESANVKLIVIEAKTNRLLASKDTDEVFSSASLIKVPILVAVLDYVENKNLSLQQNIVISSENRVEFSVLTELDVQEATLYELMAWMIITSDNTATNVLIDFLGFENLNLYFNKIGLKDTRLQRKMMDFERLEKGFNNVTSARDMGNLFSQIYRHELLSNYSETVIEILSRQRIHESLKRYLVDDIRIAHKTGSLETVEHDIGIVFSEMMDYIIGVFVTEHTNNKKTKKLIGKLSRIVYEHLGKGSAF